MRNANIQGCELESLHEEIKTVQHASSPVGDVGGFKSRIRPAYPQRVVKGDLMGRRCIALDADMALNNNLT